VKQKKARLASQRLVVSGCRKIHMLVLVSAFTGTTIDHPDSVNGMVKSTSAILLAVIVTSPTTMSAFCGQPHTSSISTQIDNSQMCMV
jgi:hypothetical protein